MKSKFMRLHVVHFQLIVETFCSGSYTFFFRLFPLGQLIHMYLSLNWDVEHLDEMLYFEVCECNAYTAVQQHGRFIGYITQTLPFRAPTNSDQNFESSFERTVVEEIVYDW